MGSGGSAGRTAGAMFVFAGTHRRVATDYEHARQAEGPFCRTQFMVRALVGVGRGRVGHVGAEARVEGGRRGGRACEVEESECSAVGMWVW